MLEQSELRKEALKKFAALTTHSEAPETLSDKFVLSYDEQDPSAEIGLKFGKRSHVFAVAPEDWELTLEEFSTKYLTSAAQSLLDSKS